MLYLWLSVDGGLAFLQNLYVPPGTMSVRILAE